MSALTDLIAFLVAEQEKRAADNTESQYVYCPLTLLINAFSEQADAVTLFGAGAPVGAVGVGTLYFDTAADYQGYVYHADAWNPISAVAVP